MPWGMTLMPPVPPPGATARWGFHTRCIKVPLLSPPRVPLPGGVPAKGGLPQTPTPTWFSHITRRGNMVPLRVCGFSWCIWCHRNAIACRKPFLLYGNYGGLRKCLYPPPRRRLTRLAVGIIWRHYLCVGFPGVFGATQPPLLAAYSHPHPVPKGVSMVYQLQYLSKVH